MKNVLFFCLLSIAIFTILIAYQSTIKTTKKKGLKQAFNKQAKVGMGIGTPEDKFARFTETYNMLADPSTGKIPPFMREKEMAFAKTLPTAKKSAKKSFDFKARGPYNVGGRTRAFAMDVRNEAVMLAGSVSGGLWKSVDAGESWYKVTSAMQNLSITTIVQDVREGHQDDWYFGTGELFGASQSSTGAFYFGNGVYKSTDNGENWTVLPNTSGNPVQSFSSEWQGIWRIAIDASNMDETEIYVASYARIHRSVDGGKNWTVAFGTGINGDISYFTDVSITSEGVVYVALSKENEIIQSGNGAKGGIWRSATGKGDFVNILPEDFPTSYNRIALGIAPSDENQIYFAVANVDSLAGKRASTPTQDDEFNGLWKYIYKGDDGSGEGGEWFDLTQNIYRGPDQFDDFYVQGGYDLTVAVKPDDPDVVFLGGTNLFRSTDGFSTADNIEHIGGYEVGASLPIVKSYPNHHADQHGLLFLPSDPNVLFSYHDGGVSKTTNCLARNVEWETLNNGYISSQFYTLAIDHSEINNQIMGGLQDNGTYFTNKVDSAAAWAKPYGADGGYCAIPGGQDYVIVSTQRGRMLKIKTDIDGNALEYQRFDPALERSDFAFINAFTLDPSTNDNLYMPIGAKLWIREAISEIPFENNFDSTSVGWKIYPDTIQKANTIFTRITPSRANPFNRLYLGSNSKNVYRIDKINNEDITTFTNVTGAAFPGEAFVSDIAVNPHNGSKALVAFSNYNVYSIFYTEDSGESWEKVAGNLEQFSSGNGNGPSVRVVDILPNEDRAYQYFAGTSIGLFQTSELKGDSTVWEHVAAGTIGNSIVTAIESREEDAYVAVATHGNGVFSANTPDDPFVDIETPVIFNGVKVYPNPVSDVLNIQFKMAKPTSVQFNLYDELGRNIEEVSKSLKARQGAQQMKFNVAHLPKGIYYYELKSENYQHSGGVVLE